MFSPSMDSARDAGGVAGTVLIPMRFVWPYGGRSVYLSGTFTRSVFCRLLQLNLSAISTLLVNKVILLSYLLCWILPNSFRFEGGLNFYKCRHWKAAQLCFKLFIAWPLAIIRSVCSSVLVLDVD